MAEVFLALEENNNGKDSLKKTTKKKRQDKKTSATKVISKCLFNKTATRSAYMALLVFVG